MGTHALPLRRDLCTETWWVSGSTQWGCISICLVVQACGTRKGAQTEVSPADQKINISSVRTGKRRTNRHAACLARNINLCLPIQPGIMAVAMLCNAALGKGCSPRGISEIRTRARRKERESYMEKPLCGSRLPVNDHLAAAPRQPSRPPYSVHRAAPATRDAAQETCTATPSVRSCSQDVDSTTQTAER